MKQFYAQCNSVLKNPYGFWCKKFLFALLAIFCFGTVSAQVILNTSNWSYAQDFNTLANTGTSSALPNGWFFTESGTGANTVYTAGTGSGTAGDTYSFGAASSTERAFGSLQSGSVATIIGAAFTNVISTDINSMTFSYTGETWRVGAANRSDRLDFQYSTDATSLTTGTWIDLDALDYVNPGQATGNGSMQHSANMTGNLAITLPTGSTLWIRWIDANVSGSDDGMGIDDFNLSYTNVVPSGSADIPQSYAIINFGGSDVYYDLKSSTANPDFNGANLGTFASGGSLWLDGAQNKIEKCGSYDVTANHLLYRIYPTASPSGSFNSVNLPWFSNDGGGGGCSIQTWQEAGAGINLLSGLCDGNYTVEVYTTADYTGGGGGTVLANNGGANYKANFTIANPVNSGIFESYAVVNGSWYDLQAATGNPDFNGANLGTFNSASGSLIVNGGQNKTYKCPPDDITGGAIYYRVYPQGSPSGSFTPVNFNWASNDPGALCPGGQNQTWQNTGNSTPNLITGLPDGTYSLEVYNQANYTGACGSGIHYSSNGGANYIANFQVGSAPSITNPGTQNAIGSSCVAVVNYNITSTGLAPITYTYSFSFNAVTYDSGSGTGSGSTFGVGTTTVTITATNSLGTDVESFDVIVTDNTAPIIFPQDATVYLDAAGNASITAGQVDAGTVDDCGVQSVTVSPANFNCSNLSINFTDLIISEYLEGSGNNKAIEIFNGTGASVNLQSYALRLYSNGAVSVSAGLVLPNFNLANGATYVIVNNSGGVTTSYDLISPTVINFNGDDAVALVKNPTTATTGGTLLDVFGRIGEDPGSAWTSGPNTTVNATLVRKSTVTSGVSTNPGAGFPTLSSEWDVFPTDNVSDLGSHTPIGLNTVTLTATDINGNVATATAHVTVLDNLAPSAPTIADATGECSVTVTAPSATDNCAGTVTGTTSDPTTYNVQGSYVVTWTFDDGNGNTSTATQNVIVDDVTAPSAPTIADATGECSVTVSAPSATDNCSGTVTGTTSDPTTYNVQGSYVVTWTFDDGNGNTSTATQNVIVDDVTAPTAPTIADATGECSVTVTAPTATDNCGGTVTGTTSDPTTYSTQGSYTVTWTFDDGNGNTSTATQNVIVDDVTAPAAPGSLPDVVAECSATLTAPTASDNCAGTITATTTDPVSYIAQGNYTVTWTFDDGNGNVSSVDQNVIIDDVTAPSAPTLTDATGECSVSVTAPTATDNCAGTVTGTTSDPTTYSTQGSYVVTWTFDDGNGNTSTTTQNVIVNDVTAPVAPASLPDATGECAVTLNGPVVVDNCGSNITGTAMDPITGIESTTITIVDQGTTIVTWTFTDASGNSSTVDQTVIIDDITAPPAPASLPTLTDECSYTVTTFPTAEDECVKTVEGIPTDPGTGTVLSSLTFNTQGIHTIRWVFDDGNGNSSYADQDIVIQDVTAPVMACPANITLSSSQATATWTDPTATDNCGAVTVTQTAGPASGSTFAPGTTTTITYQATDAAGLSTTCSFTVTRNAGINVNVTYTPINCYGGWSLVHVTASGGYAPYWGVGYFFVPAGTYNFTVWDSHGQNGTTTVTITQPTPIVVACGTNNPELFFGYSADNTAQIVASASGGTPPYKISFSMNRRLYCNVSNSSGDETWVAGANTATNTYTVCPGTGSYWQPPVSTSTATLGEGDTYSLTVSLMEDAVITATITDANGCVQKCTTPIFASDVRCAGNKVKLCHKQGSHGCRTICVDESAVANHLAHGDFLGECNYHCHPHNNNPWWWGPGWGWWGPWWGWWNGWWPWWNGKTNTTAATLETSKAGTIQEEATGIDIFSLKVAPNPSATEFVLQVNSANHTDRMLVNIYDISGKIYKQFKANPSQMIKFGANMRPGTYLVEVLQSGRRKTATVIKL